jgi:hypothetical protein
MTITPKPSYSTSEIRNVAQRGQLLQIRSGAILTDHGDTAATASEFGTALTSAIAALQAGDSLHMRGFEASGKNWDVTTNNVRIVAEEVTLLPQSNWDFGLRLNSVDDCYVQGLHIDGKSAANTGLGEAFWVLGDRNILRRNSSANTRGQSAQAASVWMYTGDDCAVFDHVSINDGWYGIAAGGNRFVLDGFVCINPLSRALNPFAPTAALQYQVYRNVHAVQNVLTTAASISLNANYAYTVSDLYIENCQFNHGDNHAPGVSWDDVSTPQLAKFQDITRLHLSNVILNHGSNSASGFDQSMRFDSPPNVYVSEVYMNDCRLAGCFNFATQRPDVVRWNNCHFGTRHMNRAELITDFSCKDFLAESCTFNSHAGSTLDFEATHAATDWTRFVNCRFTCNNAANRYVRSSGTPRTNIGRFVFSGCTLDNTGAGEMYLSSSELDDLAMSTDRNGNLLFDASRVGTGANKHPAPGAGPTYFTGMPVPTRNGMRIYNIDFTTAGPNTYPERVWTSNGGSWKNGT